MLCGDHRRLLFPHGRRIWVPPGVFSSFTACKRFSNFLEKAESDGILPNSLDKDSIAACEELAVDERGGTFTLFPLKKRR